MIELTRAPPYCTVQDLGRTGFRALGVPPSGAMDRAALAWANRALGNRPGAAGLEFGLGPGGFSAGGPVRTVVAGDVEVTRNGTPVSTGTVLELAPGDRLEIGVPATGRFGYLAVAGGVDVPLVLGSRSTYLPGRFGGLEGRLVRTGDRLPIGPDHGDLMEPSLPTSPGGGPIRVLEGPQASLFDPDAWELLGTGVFTVARSADRMGYRIEGPPLPNRARPDLPSEPACPGAIQVPAGGTPIVLMPDGPTVGGYPKIAVVLAADLGRLAQRQPGSQVRFERVSVEGARLSSRESAW